MQITDVKARVLRIPRSSRLTTSYGSEDNATTILIEILTDDGVRGIGQASVDAPFYGETAEGMLANIRTHLAPTLKGMDPMSTTACRQAMSRALPHHEFSHSGVDMALLDLKGRALGVPMYDLFGGKVRDGLTLMGFVHHGTPDAMAASAVRLVEEFGFTIAQNEDRARSCRRHRAIPGRRDGVARARPDTGGWQHGLRALASVVGAR